MIRVLHGVVLSKLSSSMVVLVGGVGYEVWATQQLLLNINEGSAIQLHIQHVFREDEQLLFGFTESKELECFKLLTSVTGVGPKVALSLLSANTVNMVAQAIIGNDTRLLLAASGVGKKLAERIVLELKDRIPSSMLDSSSKTVVAANPTDTLEAEMALVALGFRESSVRSALANVIKDGGNPDTQSLIKQALKLLR